MEIREEGKEVTEEEQVAEFIKLILNKKIILLISGLVLITWITTFIAIYIPLISFFEPPRLVFEDNLHSTKLELEVSLRHNLIEDLKNSINIHTIDKRYWKGELREVVAAERMARANERVAETLEKLLIGYTKEKEIYKENIEEVQKKINNRRSRLLNLDQINDGHSH